MLEGSLQIWMEWGCESIFIEFCNKSMLMVAHGFAKQNNTHSRHIWHLLCVFAFVGVVIVLIENAIFLFPFHYCLFRSVQKQKKEWKSERKYKVKWKQKNVKACFASVLPCGAARSLRSPAFLSEADKYTLLHVRSKNILRINGRRFRNQHSGTFPHTFFGLRRWVMIV